MRLVIDIETNGFLHELTKVHCLASYNLDSGEMLEWTPENIREGIDYIYQADQLIGHNLIGFDIPAIRKVYPFFKDYPDEQITDTLLLAELCFPDRYDRDLKKYQKCLTLPKNMWGRHSLKSYGIRLGELKDDYEGGFDEWNPEMQSYMVQDVTVTVKLYETLLPFIKKRRFSDGAIRMEHQVRWITEAQERSGFPFNMEAAEALVQELMVRRAELEGQLQQTFGSWYVFDDEYTPTRKGKLSGNEGIKFDKVVGAPYSKIKHVVFNPGSSSHIVRAFAQKYNWEPTEFTDKGTPKMDEQVLSGLEFPEAKLLEEYKIIQKLLGYLAEGNSSWFKSYNKETGCIHGRVKTLGTRTTRMSHVNPNLAQVPSVDKPFGKECRALFGPHKGHVQVGVDVSGLEAWGLAHYLAKHDGGEYAEKLKTSDIHEINQKAIELPSRSAAKPVYYCLVYGGGDAKLGKIVGGGVKEGAEIRAKLFSNIPGLSQLTGTVNTFIKSKGGVPRLDGGLITDRAAYKALNTLLQGNGAVICKYWMVLTHELIKSKGWQGKVIQLATVHDELQFSCDPEIAEEFAQGCVDMIAKAGKQLGLRVPLTGEYKIGPDWSACH